jgi:hypothetical protein
MTANKKAKVNWSHDEYESSVNEGEETTYDVYKLRGKDKNPRKGDMIVLFYAPTKDPKGGICGYGEVSGYDEHVKTIDFRPVWPSDYLKTKPMWNHTVKGIIDKVRLGYPRGNMWIITPDLFTRLRQMIDQIQRL